jgi:hypothetical protein
MNSHRTTEDPPEGWTPQADSDRQWQAIATLLRESDKADLPGEERWEEVRSTVWREAGIGETARVVPVGAPAGLRPLARVLQVAAVAVAAFALGWFLNPTHSTTQPAHELAALPPVGHEAADPDKEVVVPGGLPGRITPSVPDEGITVPVTANSADPTPPRGIIRIHDVDGPAPARTDGAEALLLPEFLRALRAQPDQAITPEAIVASIESLLRDDPQPAMEASLRFLKAEVLLLEFADPTAATQEYEAVLRLTGNEGSLAESARSRLAGMR